MGCLKNILRAIILTLAVVGFMALGGKELVSGLINNYFNPPKDTMLERAQKVGDFSKINDEFEIERAAGIMGYNAVVAEHKASGQKMFVVDSGDKDILTAEDIKSENVEEKLYKAISKIKYQAVSVEDLKVTKHGTMHSYGKEVPYVKFEARIKKLPIGDIGGIISVAETKDGESRLLISANEKSKYSQLISDEFFKKIK
ncbi:unknown [Clostridium sp. CAG:768]|nr:unknown [Clostridium sp. CAG:768]